jgi:hypothetical protein
MIPQSLHIFTRGAIRRLRHLGYVIKQCAFRGAQARFFQIPVRDCVDGFVFCSLNTQEVCMRV